MQDLPQNITNLSSPCKQPKLYLFDVGHGNFSVLMDTLVTFLDCGPSGKFVDNILESLKISKVHNVVLSHPDTDHIGGLPHLIEAVPLERILGNSDPSKESKIWYKTIEWLETAETLGTEVIIGLTTFYGRRIPSGEVEIEILAPSTSLAFTGVGGKYLGQQTVTSNTMSVVVRLIHQGCPVVLLPGDLDDFGLDLLLARQENIEAKILVFPHHGGSCGGGDDYEFARRLCSAVKPETVLFSYSRTWQENPREQIIAGLRAVCPKALIMCTQLSRKCSPQIPRFRSSHLTVLPALGKSNKSCCGGSICIKLNGDQTAIVPDPGAHRLFVESLPQPLCLRQRRPDCQESVLSRP